MTIKKPDQKETITIIGAGPVGSLLAVILGRMGYQVNLIESRRDCRKYSIYQGKSIAYSHASRSPNTI